ncbi:hypothetical protein BCR37DRAFT_81823 [Protomyces lactucae-debilis]|uniref:Uncharacterized protein n=1 Tax=Protomyces lactucae-debilis TaxID=2754530 RepID=A0A1Y2F8M0_PROLT|nr:uncharacterized protein BCR37DRAFT_81823 [Protomyces lactucae-debilis]ORY79967.1 hypothetical protein BCR37DRAFT_81823 [Protomyces lactucae-debilis]
MLVKASFITASLSMGVLAHAHKEAHGAQPSATPILLAQPPQSTTEPASPVGTPNPAPKLTDDAAKNAAILDALKTLQDNGYTISKSDVCSTAPSTTVSSSTSTSVNVKVNVKNSVTIINGIAFTNDQPSGAPGTEGTPVSDGTGTGTTGLPGGGGNSGSDSGSNGQSGGNSGSGSGSGSTGPTGYVVTSSTKFAGQVSTYGSTTTTVNGGTPGSPNGTPGSPDGTPGSPSGTPGSPDGTPSASDCWFSLSADGVSLEPSQTTDGAQDVKFKIQKDSLVDQTGNVCGVLNNQLACQSADAAAAAGLVTTTFAVDNNVLSFNANPQFFVCAGATDGTIPPTPSSTPVPVDQVTIPETGATGLDGANAASETPVPTPLADAATSGQPVSSPIPVAQPAPGASAPSLNLYTKNIDGLQCTPVTFKVIMDASCSSGSTNPAGGDPKLSDGSVLPKANKSAAMPGSTVSMTFAAAMITAVAMSLLF